MTGDEVIARLFFEMTRVIHKTYMPDTRFGTFLDLVPVAMRSSWAKPKAAQHTTEGVTQAQQATAELAGMSADLRTLVSHFRY